MVALDEQLHHDDTFPVSVHKSWQSGRAVQSNRRRSGKSVDQYNDQRSNTNYQKTGIFAGLSIGNHLSAGAVYREKNKYPAGSAGAAAHSRGLGKEFRGIEETDSAGERRSSQLNINGANTYQFVESNPVENVDTLGQSWYNPRSWGWVQTTEGTFSDAVGINGGAVAGAFWTGAGQGAIGGASIDANTLSFGLTDHIGVTNSNQYQGGAFGYARALANLGRDGLVAAGTGGTAALGDWLGARLGLGLGARAFTAGLGSGSSNLGVNTLDNIESDQKASRGWWYALIGGFAAGAIPFKLGGVRAARGANWWDGQGIGGQNLWNGFLTQNPQFVQDAANQAALYDAGGELLGEGVGHVMENKPAAQ